MKWPGLGWNSGVRLGSPCFEPNLQREGCRVRTLCGVAKGHGVGRTLGLHLSGDGRGLARHRGVDVGDGTLNLGTLRVQASLGFCNPAPLMGGLNPA